MLWGTNLGFSVRPGRLTKQERDMMKLPRFHFSVIIGLILSDGWLIRASARSKNCRLGFAQSLAHFKYIWFVFTLLSPYCSSHPTYRIRERLDKISYSIEFFTRSLPCFTELLSIFYVNKVKVIPEDVYNLLTPVALAHWIQGDGSVQRHGLILCTNSFSLPDVVRLMNVLMIRYGLECTIHIKRRPGPGQKIEHTIYILQGSMPLLRTIVTPYFHPSMYYKLGL